MKDFIETTWTYFHEHPELGFEEFATTKHIVELLEGFGYAPKVFPAGTGAVAVLDSGCPGPVLGLRADIDCLAFTTDGKVEKYHACGHDGNITMLLAAAKQLKEDGIKRGKVYFIFQPAEETLKGSLSVIESGYISDMEEIVGMHLQPDQEEQYGHAAPRLLHKSYGRVEVTVHGRNAHASLPYLGINATEAGVQIVNAVNCIRCDARSPYSCKVTIFKADGSSHNTIPDKALLVFDIRADTNDTMSQIMEKLKIAAEHAAASVGATAEISDEVICYSASYDPVLCDEVKSVLCDVLGEEQVRDACPATTSEDFHNYSNQMGAKAAYISLGASFTPFLHANHSFFNHDALLSGAKIWIGVAHKRLG
ncbi:amidohydrolase [Oscillibacter hominis]|uniref:Amidohydrolase n=1 Tax=Oscillibacter hominis TaxID=2763056 RepID=A0A7G9B755_9FIRM|nr:amidohydrolase [Oscillibacter hominis]QNL45386.1 amidohydrolase [Oscillibacter hominis]